MRSTWYLLGWTARTDVSHAYGIGRRAAVISFRMPTYGAGTPGASPMPRWRCDWRIRPSSMTTPETTLASFWLQTRVWWCGEARRFRNGSGCELGWMRARVGTILDGARLWR